MSNPDAVATATQVSDTVQQVLPVVETVASAFFPGAGTAIALAFKIATGVAAEAPEAVKLFEQFKSGTIPDQAELDAYANEENGSYNKLMADIAAARTAHA